MATETLILSILLGASLLCLFLLPFVWRQEKLEAYRRGWYERGAWDRSVKTWDENKQQFAPDPLPPQVSHYKNWMSLEDVLQETRDD